MKSPAVSDATLREIPIFKNMNDSERRQIAEIASVVDYSQGVSILTQGNASQNLWIVLNGECEIAKDPAPGQPGSMVRLAVLAPYSNFGEMSFFHKAVHSANVKALTPVRLLRIERADYDELVQEGCCSAYKLACNALDSLAERLRRMDDWVAQLMQQAQQPLAAGAPLEQVPEWLAFRDKLFTGWNL